MPRSEFEALRPGQPAGGVGGDVDCTPHGACLQVPLSPQALTARLLPHPLCRPSILRPQAIDFATFDGRGPLLAALEKRAAAKS